MRGAMKGGLRVGDWLRNVTAEGRETWEDVYHEARSELETERREPAGPVEVTA